MSESLPSNTLCQRAGIPAEHFYIRMKLTAQKDFKVRSDLFGKSS